MLKFLIPSDRRRGLQDKERVSEKRVSEGIVHANEVHSECCLPSQWEAKCQVGYKWCRDHVKWFSC
jgi:hypothetical protein